MKKIVVLLAALLLAPGIATAAERKTAQEPPASSTRALQQKLDLNRVSLEELVGVPGIGPRMAQAIVDLRLKKGSFKQIEDLLEVTGIKKKKLAAIAGYLEVRALPAPIATTSTATTSTATTPTATMPAVSPR